MANQTLIGTWTIRANAMATAVTSTRFVAGYHVDITDASPTASASLTVVDPSGPTTILTVSGNSFQMASDKLTANYVFLSNSGETITGVVECTPGSSVSSIVGFTTKNDPETVAVWGGDDQP